MDRYIGLDVHASSCTLAVVGPSGRKLGSQVLETNGRALVEALRAIPRPRHVCFEEGTQSAWLYEVLSPPRRRARSDASNHQPRAEERPARRSSAGSIASPRRARDTVFKAPRRFTRLRALVRVHSMLVRDVTRAQCRVKAMFRERGIRTDGSAVYSEDGRSTWLRQLPAPTKSPPNYSSINSTRLSS